MKEIIVDGVTYVPKENDARAKWCIAVLDRGFVYVGLVSRCINAEGKMTGIVISNARAIVRWGTNLHLGELVNGPLPNTKLGAPCTVNAPTSSVVHTIDVEESKWNSK